MLAIIIIIIIITIDYFNISVLIRISMNGSNGKKNFLTSGTNMCAFSLHIPPLLKPLSFLFSPFQQCEESGWQ